MYPPHWPSHWTNIWRQTFSGQLICIVIFKNINTFVYNFNVCCQGETRRRLVVQRHLCFEWKMADKSTTKSVLKIYWPCIEYTRLPHDHFNPIISLITIQMNWPEKVCLQMLVQWLGQCSIPQVTKYCYSDTYESLTHSTKTHIY
jgi:hypothetical protein